VSSTGILKGTGSISGSVSVQSGGTLAAGASIQSLATGALTLAGGATFAYEFDNNAAATVGGDLTAVTGGFNLDPSNLTNLTLTELGSGTWEVGDKLTLVSYSGAWNNGLFNFGGVVADDSSLMFNGVEWLLNYNDTVPGTNFVSDLTGTNYVTITALTVVPEPGAMMSVMAGFGVLAALRRRRSS
jgi:hypothetical protein